MRFGIVRRTTTADYNRVFLLAVTLAASAGLLTLLAGCNTFKGVGRDVEAIAQGGQDIIDGK